MASIAPRGYWDLGQAIYEHMTPKRNLISYFDESGKFSNVNCEAVVVGGFVVDVGQRHALMNRWVKILNDAGLDRISMKDALDYSDQCESLKGDKETRDEILLSLADVAMSPSVMRIWGMVTTAEFNSLSARVRKRVENPQYFAFEACMRAIFGMDNIIVQTVYDLSEDYSAATVKLFNTLRRKNPIAEQRCPVISFCDDHVEPGLQMADMIAFCGRAEKLPHLRTQPIVDKLILLFKLDARNEPGVMFKDGALGTGELS
jgi:hypothetical protein